MATPPTLCIIGGCNGAGKSTLARELLPRLSIPRFLNADLIAKGLSPGNPGLAAFTAGRKLLEEAQSLISAGNSFAIESTLSGKTYVKLLQQAREKGFKVLLHYIMISSASQAVARVKFRVLTGGHHVPEDDIRRRYERSVKHFKEDYLPLADEWGLWENVSPPAVKIAGDSTHTKQEAIDMITSSTLQESEPMKYSEMDKIVLEASRVATEKMMHLYERMGIKVTPEITLAPDSPPPSFQPFALW
ncbi:MAG: AAA family ATPase [Verrucomicrobiota bacterium]